MKTTRRIHSIVCSLTAAATLLLADRAQAQVTVSAQYLGDNTSFTITNNFPKLVTGITITGVGYGGNSTSGSISVPNLAPGGSYVFAFDNSSTAFTEDFDDGISGQAAYTLTGTVAGRPISLTFSPNNNATGGFLPFLGNDSSGFELDDDVPNTLVGIGTAQLQQFLINPELGALNLSGTIPATLLNYGVFGISHSAPVELQGDFLQFPTGDLVIELKSKTKFSMLTVDGLALLRGGVTFQAVDGFLPQAQEKFTFLTAKGGIFGFFDWVNNNSGSTGTILGYELIYTPYSITLEFTQGSFEDFAAGLHLSPNQYAVGEALDNAVAADKSRSLIRFLDNEPLSKLPGDFDRLAAEELTSIFTLGVSLAQVQAGNIQRRTDDIRSGTSGFSAAGLSVNGVGPSYSGGFGVAGPSGDDGKETKEMKSVVAPENRWGAFLSGTGEWVSVGNTDNARGYDLTSGGFTLGIDYKVTPNLAVGLAAGYTGTTADLTDRGRIWVNGGKIGLYGTFFQNEEAAAASTMSKDSSKDSSKEAAAPAPSIAKGFYADVAVFGGYNSYDTRRSALLGEARGETDGGELNVLFGTGYDIKAGGLTFGPTATFNYTYVGTSEFTEHGSLAPLDIHGGKGESLRTALGLKASYDLKIGRVLVKPEIRAAWQHEFGDSSYELGSSFANGAGDTFVVNGPQIGRDSVLLGAGFAIQCSERCSTYFYYDGELGRQNYQSTAVTGGFRLAF